MTTSPFSPELFNSGTAGNTTNDTLPLDDDDDIFMSCSSDSDSGSGSESSSGLSFSLILEDSRFVNVYTDGYVKGYEQHQRETTESFLNFVRTCSEETLNLLHEIVQERTAEPIPVPGETWVIVEHVDAVGDLIDPEDNKPPKKGLFRRLFGKKRT